MSSSWEKFTNNISDDYFLDGSTRVIYNGINNKFNIMLNKKKPNRPKPSHEKCRWCESNYIIIKSKQTRSGDEGATTFLECFDCKKKWSVN